MSKAHRGTIVCEQAELVAREVWPAEQYVLTLHAPEIARRAAAGAFVHVRCSAALPMRRPMSIMRADAGTGHIAVLFKVVGQGTAALAQQAEGAALSVMGPIGQPFPLPAGGAHPVLLGGGVGIPPMLLLAAALKAAGLPPALVAMGSEVPFPFADACSSLPVGGIDDIGEARCVPELEHAGIPSRLATTQGYAGCFDGYVTDLAAAHLAALDDQQRASAVLYACGPTPMLKASAELAARLGVRCYVSMEEFMACAVGGCAGCVVPARDGNRVAMRRVCVDGPVFDAAELVWEQLGAH